MGLKHNFCINDSLFYVAGAVIGDGCLYNSGKYYYLIILNGTEGFVRKYAKHLQTCSDSKINIFYRKSHNVWEARTNNKKLFKFLLQIKKNSWKIFEYVNGFDNASLLFLEGFFDAEGCVKIIKEPVRITPKICLDMTNTNLEYLEVCRCLLDCCLGIKGNYSIQKEGVAKDGVLRKKCYHLRIYKKDYVRTFFSNINTVKLYKEKRKYVKNWLALNKFKHSNNSY